MSDPATGAPSAPGCDDTSSSGLASSSADQGSTERRSRRSVAVVIVAITAALLLCCAGAVGAIFVARNAMDTALDTYTSGSEWVRWSGEGRFAVIQSYSEDGTPLVAVWDSTTGEVRVENGYHALAVEPLGARVWMAASTAPDGTQRPEPVPTPIAADTDDLVVWSLEDGSSGPTTPSTLEWDSWPGSAGRVLLATSSAARGAFPALSVEDPSTGSAIPVAVPEGAGAIELLGWSPSGEYFAVIGRARDDLPVHVVIIDAVRDAGVVSVHTPVVVRPGSPGAAWLPAEDTLVLSVPSEEGAIGTEAAAGRLMMLYPDGTFVEAEGESVNEPLSVGDGVGLAVIGAGPDGVVVAVGEMVWLLGQDGPEQVGRLPAAHSTAYHPRGGALSLDEEWSDRDATIRTVVSHSGTLAGTMKTIWEGPERSVAFGLKGR